MQRPILILGPRKSGTTLILNLLDGTEGLFVIPSEVKLSKLLCAGCEISFEEFERHDSVSLFMTAENKKEFAKRRYIRSSEFPMEISKALCDYALDVHQVVFPLSELGSWVIKDVGGDAEKVCKYFLAAFPKGRIILVKRRSAMVTRAVFTDRRRRGKELGWRERFTQVIDPILYQRAYKKVLNHTRVAIVDYEELVESPNSTMQRITQFNDVSSLEEKRILPSIFGSVTHVITASKSEEGVFKSRAGWWSDISNAERLAIISGPVLITIKDTRDWLRRWVT